jgi:hypothetical protein
MKGITLLYIFPLNKVYFKVLFYIIVMSLTDNNKCKLKELYEKYNPHLKNLTFENPRLSLLTFYPLPYSLQYYPDEILEKNGYYFYLGEPTDKILFANRRIPYFKTDTIPFSFPTTEKSGKTNIIQSNIFYFEVRQDFRSNMIYFHGKSLFDFSYII